MHLYTSKRPAECTCIPQKDQQNALVYLKRASRMHLYTSKRPAECAYIYTSKGPAECACTPQKGQQQNAHVPVHLNKIPGNTSHKSLASLSKVITSPTCHTRLPHSLLIKDEGTHKSQCYYQHAVCKSKKVRGYCNNKGPLSYENVWLTCTHICYYPKSLRDIRRNFLYTV